MSEACFCGWTGATTEKQPVPLGDGTWGLRCPDCGRVDRLEWVAPAGRLTLLQLAQEESARRTSAA